jgi:hypothetical protein
MSELNSLAQHRLTRIQQSTTQLPNVLWCVLLAGGGGQLENRAVYGAADLPVTDPNIAFARRWAKVHDLRGQINGLEGDAQEQEDLAYQLKHTGNGKNNTMTKLFNAVGSVPAGKYHAEAAKHRAEATRLREQLAGIEDQEKSPSVPTP